MKYKNISLRFLKIIMYMCIISYDILGKGKYTLHTIARLIVFTHAFCHAYVQNLLKGPVIVSECK